MNPALPDFSENPILSEKGQRDLCETIAAAPFPSSQLATRLQYVADVIENAGKLPPAQVLAWWESEQSVRCARINGELIVGRQAEDGGLSLESDKLLSRHHFKVRVVENRCLLQDLQSRNGTAINCAENRVQRKQLHDGDIIFAGNHIFVFLDNTLTC